MSAKLGQGFIKFFHPVNTQIPPCCATHSDDVTFLQRLPDNMIIAQTIGILKSMATIDQIIVLLTLGLIVNENKDLITKSSRTFDIRTVQTLRKVVGDIFDHQVTLQPGVTPNLTQNNEVTMKILNTLPSLSFQELAYVHGICGIALENHPRFEESTIHKLYRSFGTKITGALKRIAKGLM